MEISIFKRVKLIELIYNAKKTNVEKHYSFNENVTENGES